ncbi:MAG: GAF domain-containing protein, partial [Dehalococcoidia bacterium]
MAKELVALRQQIGNLEASERERKRAEEEQTRLRRRLEALWEIASMVDADYKTLCDRVLAQILAMTQSYYARYGFINEDESMFTLYAWSAEALRDCKVRGRPLHRPVVNGGLWADAVRHRKTLVINDYQADHPGKKGVPEGHIPLTRVLMVPIFSHGCIAALATVANKPSDYTEEDARQVEAFATGVQVILERRRAEEQLCKVNRSLRTLSLCNQGLVRATEEQALLQEICRTIVGSGGYSLAWVGFAEQDEKKAVRPVAQAGYEGGYLDTVDITWADTERGRGPTGTAIRTGKPIIARNLLTDPNFVPWRAEALKRGYASSIALPLVAGEQAIGALNIYAGEPDAFAADEVGLFTEMADDLAYGIMTLRAKAESQRAQHALGERAKELTCLYAVSQLVAKTGGSMDDVLRGAVGLIPPGWQYPEVTCARITFHGQEFRTGNFASTKWKQSSDIKADGEKVGTVEVYYLERKPEIDEGPFLKEERSLIDGLARILGEMAEHKQADEERIQHANELEMALEQIKATQTQLMQSDRLATIGQLVSGVAHEVNNPLTAVMGYAQLLLRGDLDEDAKSRLEVIYHEARRAAAICRNLLSFARQHKPEKSYISANEAVESTLTLRA